MPPLDVPLSGIDHALLRKASEQVQGGVERMDSIAAIDDLPLRKVKVPGFRGALLVDDDGQAWLVAAGVRRDDTPAQDFYDQLAEEGRRHRRHHNRRHRPPLATDTHTQHLLPTSWDHGRLTAESQVAAARAAATEVEREVPALARQAAAQLGTEQTATIAGADVAMQIEHDEVGMAWLGVRVVGPVNANLHAVLLAEVPGTAKDDWAWDGAGMPGRGLHQGEVVYSAIIDLDALP